VLAVHDVALGVEPGQVVGLIGPNGAGKTSLIDAVTGFARSTGRIAVDGVAIGTWPAHRRARAGVSRSFQSLELFEDVTVGDNLRVASDPRDRRAYLTDLVAPGDPPLTAAALEAVREFGLAAQLDALPGDLSYGERRLAAVARAVATEPSILLLDEPASGLGQQESRELAELVRRLADEWGIAVLLVEHDMDLVMRVCDRITVLDFGRVIAEGTPEEVRADPAVVAAYLGEPLRADAGVAS
jgi:sulfate-transporting ATPase